jgi:branched-chain amino acid transport system permease protein
MGIWSIVALGLNVITGYAGQFNLGIGVYMGTGAYTAAMLTTGAGFGFWEAVPFAAGASAVMGLLTGLPALRVREDSLAVFTIGIVFVFESLLIYLPYFGGPVGIGRIPHPVIWGAAVGRDGYLIIVVGALVATIATTFYIKRTWMGLAWASIRENELATSIIGIRPARYKLYAFIIGSVFAGIGGALYAHFIHYVTPYDFGFLPSIYVLVMIVLGGIGTIRGAIFGACFLTLLPELSRFVQDYRNLIYGGTLILLMLYEPRGMLGEGSFIWKQIISLRNRLTGTRFSPERGTPSPERLQAAPTEPIPAPTPLTPPQSQHLGARSSLLQTCDITQRFGGLLAVNGVSLEVFPREIFGVIGPNGAGKTTFFNLLSGIVHCTSGQIIFKGREIQTLPPDRVAQLGIGRTFQIVRPFADLTVLENVLAGIGANHCGSIFSALQLSQRKRHIDRAHDLLRRVKLDAYAGVTSSELPLGLLRRLEIARALAINPALILLDESFSGLSAAEAQSLADLVLALQSEGLTIIMIEHNMQITMKLCGRLAVLSRGEKIAEGTPREIREHRHVIAAYLGSDDGA